MDCPRCHHASKIEETRRDPDGKLRRYRRCSACRQRFTTVETLDMGSVLVKKRTGETEPFSRSKLTKSIRKAAIAELPTAEVNELVNRVTQLLSLDEAAPDESGTPSLSSTTIGETVLKVLRDELRLQVVHVRYALLFEPQRGSFSDAATFLAWLARQDLLSEADVSVGEEPDWVVKRDGSLAPFARNKLEDSIRFAAKKRPEAGDVDKDVQLGKVVADQVLEQVHHQRIVTSGQLATEVMRALRGRDVADDLLSSGERELAYLRVASTAKSFARADDFAAEARGLLEPTSS